MKHKYKILFFLSLLSVALMILPCNTKVMADTSELLECIDNLDLSNNGCSRDIVLERNGTILLKFDDLCYGKISVNIYDSNNAIIFSQENDFVFESKEINIDGVAAGTYRVQVSVENDICDCFLSIYGVYVPDETYPEFSLSSESISIEKGETETVYVEAEPEEISYDVDWTSDNENIAKVDKNGKIKGVGIGKTTIYAELYYKDALYKTLKCKVTVKSGWHYKDYSAAMKKYAKKNKNSMTYKDIDKGRICRLYGSLYVTSSTKHLKTQGFGSVCKYNMYLELKKNGNGVTLKLYFLNEFTQLDIFDDVDLEPEKLRMKSSNRIMTFDLSCIDDTSYYNYDGGYYYGCEKSKALISNASDINWSKLKKFKTMLGQNSTWYKVCCSSGAYYSAQISKKVTKSWQKLTNLYIKLSKNI